MYKVFECVCCVHLELTIIIMSRHHGWQTQYDIQNGWKPLKTHENITCCVFGVGCSIYGFVNIFERKPHFPEFRSCGSFNYVKKLCLDWNYMSSCMSHTFQYVIPLLLCMSRIRRNTEGDSLWKSSNEAAKYHCLTIHFEIKLFLFFMHL